MTEVTDVTIVAGKPTEGDGTVATISKLMGGKSISDLFTSIGTLISGILVLGRYATSSSLSVVNASDRDVEISLNLTLDTSSYSTGDVWTVGAAISDAVLVNGGRFRVNTIEVFDDDAQGAPVEFYFNQANNVLGTINAAPSISDANARLLYGPIRVGTGDYVTINGMKKASLSNIGLEVTCDASATTIYLASLIRGTATFTASGVKVKCGITRL